MDVPGGKFTSISDILSGRSGAARFLIQAVTRPPFDVGDRKQSRYLTLASTPGATHVDVTEGLARIVKIRELMGQFLVALAFAP